MMSPNSHMLETSSVSANLAPGGKRKYQNVKAVGGRTPATTADSINTQVDLLDLRNKTRLSHKDLKSHQFKTYKLPKRKTISVLDRKSPRSKDINIKKAEQLCVNESLKMPSKRSPKQPKRIVEIVQLQSEAKPSISPLNKKTKNVRSELVSESQYNNKTIREVAWIREACDNEEDDDASDKDQSSSCTSTTALLNKLSKEQQSSDSESDEHQDVKDGKCTKRQPKCKICSQIFTTYMQLKNHKKIHDGDKPYLCPKCDQNHETLEQLIAHLRLHQGKRPYLCKKCNLGFKTEKALEDHQPVHVLRKTTHTKRMFQCETCSKLFAKLSELERHTRVHTGEKPSICNICNQRFQQTHNLNKHLLIHTKEKRYQCDICSKKFGRSDVLNRHVLTHSLDKPNNCTYCMKSFIRLSQLMAHKEKYHSKLPSKSEVAS